MKLIHAHFLIFVLALTAGAQKPDDVLATTTAHTFRFGDLPAEIRLQAEKLPGQIAAARTSLLEQMINQRVLDIEARALGISTGKMLATEKVKVPNPAEAEIKDVYDANRSALGSLTLEQARKQIVAFLRREPEQKMTGALITRLKTKYRAVTGKDINSPSPAATDKVASVNGQPITAGEFEDFAKVELFEMRAGLADTTVAALNELIYAALVADEAKAVGVDSGSLIASEITNKMKDFSDEERVTLEAGLRNRLYAKYQVKILYKEPDPVAQSISIDDDPFTGPTNASVTVVMFSDFQCSACSATHPILKNVMAEFPGKVRFVVRDFPLESVHENAFNAALAANAAKDAGKFFEYIEILYKNQDALDTASLKKYAGDIGLQAKQFELIFNLQRTAAEVRRDMADGESYGIFSTPTIFVNGVRVRNLSPAGFRAAIEKALR